MFKDIHLEQKSSGSLKKISILSLKSQLPHYERVYQHTRSDGESHIIIEGLKRF